jgi:hypothetical protein
MNKRKHRVYLTLDSLFDTRLACLALIDEPLAIQLLESNKYKSRLHNDFTIFKSSFDQKGYEARYASRDLSLLKQSVSTDIVGVILDMVMRYKTGQDLPGDETDVLLTINTSPYSLNEGERAELANMVQGATTVDGVDFIHSDLTYCDGDNLAKYDTVILDDLDKWVTLHLERMGHAPMKRVQVYAPLSIKPEHAQTLSIAPSVISNVTSLCLKELMDLETLPLSLFSLRSPDSISSHSP